MGVLMIKGPADDEVDETRIKMRMEVIMIITKMNNYENDEPWILIMIKMIAIIAMGETMRGLKC